MALTHKQEKFAQLVASGKTQADAYRGAYDAENMSDGSIWTEASLLMKNSEVSQRVSEMRVPIEEQVGITLKSYIDEMMELKRKAQDSEEYGASIKALELAGKCLGFYVNKTELTGKGGEALSVKLTKEIIDTDQSKTS
jgi:hypothetical protein